MRTEIISIGSELTTGRNLDTNAQWLSRRLAEIGIPVPRWCEIADPAALDAFGREAGWPAVLKAARGGYDLMPELKEVSPWHSVGQRRSLDEMGRIAEQPLGDPSYYYRDTCE